MADCNCGSPGSRYGHASDCALYQPLPSEDSLLLNIRHLLLATPAAVSIADCEALTDQIMEIVQAHRPSFEGQTMQYRVAAKHRPEYADGVDWYPWTGQTYTERVRAMQVAADEKQWYPKHQFRVEFRPVVPWKPVEN